MDGNITQAKGELRKENVLDIKGRKLEEKDVQEDDSIGRLMNSAGEALMRAMMKVGNVETTDLTQKAKAFSGDVVKAADDTERHMYKLEQMKLEGSEMEDFTKPSVVTAAEHLMEEMIKEIKESEESLEKLIKITLDAKPSLDPNFIKYALNDAKEYYPVMYFIDKNYATTPSTCTGDLVANPVVGQNMDGCAAACDREVGTTSDDPGCVGYLFVDGPAGQQLCFLFSKLKKVTYYARCDKDGNPIKMKNGKPVKSSLLQGKAKNVSESPISLWLDNNEYENDGSFDTEYEEFMERTEGGGGYDVQCAVKLMHFEGTSIKPDPSGKCKNCLKSLTHANRCIGEPCKTGLATICDRHGTPEQKVYRINSDCSRNQLINPTEEARRVANLVDDIRIFPMRTSQYERYHSNVDYKAVQGSTTHCDTEDGKACEKCSGGTRVAFCVTKSGACFSQCKCSGCIGPYRGPQTVQFMKGPGCPNEAAFAVWHTAVATRVYPT
eukprot:gnl/TRDRNA2_/TRDRNA2_174783_c2_seq4.p1 gnl/TRDRNA2_/TRDRNA2_174783_c2~~gnl/TRDRNA2_/TRDRNA2_174783_c2_seq4.p1  ORF type:complete len:569 (-),score=134.85 gnl/TRDRNA2_/TRDRNA2_174783_c2_seq4:298-1782(-)